MHTLLVCATVLQVTFIRQAGIFALGGTSANEAFAFGRMAGWFCRRQCQGVDHCKALFLSLAIIDSKKKICIIMKKNKGTELLIFASLLKIFK